MFLSSTAIRVYNILQKKKKGCWDGMWSYSEHWTASKLLGTALNSFDLKVWNFYMIKSLKISWFWTNGQIELNSRCSMASGKNKEIWQIKENHEK